jgi:DNA modification methylase
MAKNKKDSKSTKLTDHIEETVSDEEEIEAVSLPEQEAFFKMPKRFGTIPDVSKEPLGWGKGGYAHLYPHVKLPTQRLETLPFGNRGDANKLYWGDNLHIMRTLPSGSIDLIYIDPPFFSGRNYNMIFQDQNEVMTFEDIWDGGLPTYQVWLNARLVEMKRLLKPTGSVYVHLDWHAAHYIKVEMDKIFGYDNLVNEIIWRYRRWPAKQKAFQRMHDTILWYRKTRDKENEIWNQQYEDLSESSKKQWKGKLRVDVKNEAGARHSETLSKESPGVPMSDVWEISQITAPFSEYIGYPTQKPEALLERIIKASSNEGDVVADFFCGGGTTPAVAQRLGRQWIASDISRIAIEVTKGRILRLLKSEKGTQTSFAKVPNIEVWSWGFYDADKLQDVSDEEFRDFIVRAYGGRPTSNEYTNGSKNGIPLLVGDKNHRNQITKKEVLEFARYIQGNYELNKTGTILAWGFSDSAIKAQEALANIGAEIDFVKIKTVRIGSYEFIEDVVTKNKEYKNVFRFVFPPEVVLHITKAGGEFSFDFSDSVSLNNGKIINIQADFDFDGKFAPSEGYIFNPNTMVLKHRLNSIGKKKIAFKVEDDQGGEKLVVKEVE